MMRRVLDGAVRVVLALGLLGTVSAALGEVSWLLGLAAHFRLHMLAALLPVAFLALAGRRWGAALLATVLVTANAAAVVPAFRAPEPAAPAAETSRLRVVHLNVRQDNHDHAQVAEYLLRVDPDVIALVEVDAAWVAALAPRLEAWPHRVVRERADCFGLAVFSRVPLGDAELVVPPGELEAPWLRVRVEVAGGPLDLVSLHALPPLGEAWVRGTRALLRSLASRRDLLAERAVVCGDFNLTPWAPDYRRFLEETGLREPTPGATGTWPASVPFLRLPIDHCLTTPDVPVLDHVVGPDVGSDHRPIVLDVAL